MTLQQILNWTTVGGAVGAVALVGAAWARARSEIRAAPRAVAVPRLPVRRRGMAVTDRTLVLSEPDNVGLRIIEPRGAAPPPETGAATFSGLAGDEPGHSNGDLETAISVPATEADTVLGDYVAADTVAADTVAADTAGAAPAGTGLPGSGLADSGLPGSGLPGSGLAGTGPPGSGREIMLTDQVTAGPAWTPSDSWLTSTTAVGAGVLAAVALGVGGSAAGSLLGVYALSAAVAPLVYACLGPSSPHSAAVTGSVRGYLLAALATLFGGIGMVATIWGLGASAINAVAAEVVLGIGCVLIIAVMSAYSFRTIVGVLVTQTTTRTGEPVRPAAQKMAPRTSSLLVGSQGRRSATL
jgi:hypothetical protein